MLCEFFLLFYLQTTQKPRFFPQKLPRRIKYERYLKRFPPKIKQIRNKAKPISVKKMCIVIKMWKKIISSKFVE
jgi:hypothetical protein